MRMGMRMGMRTGQKENENGNGREKDNKSTLIGKIMPKKCLISPFSTGY